MTVFACSEKNISDPKEAFENWGGYSIGKDVLILNGVYWESAHWSKEYIVYLKLSPSEEWWSHYKTVMGLDALLLQSDDLFEIDDADWMPVPDWFRPPKECEVYGGYTGSKYFWDSSKKTLWVYEIQL
jgi:hypothetical protein